MTNSSRNVFLKVLNWFNRYFWNETAEQSRPAFKRYGFVLLLMAVSTVIKLYFYWSIGGQTPFLLYFGVIIICTGYGGFGPGIFATFLAAIITIYFFLYPYGELKLDNSQAIQTFVFIWESLFLIALSGAVTTANRKFRRSGERFKALIENSNDAIAVMGGEGKVVYASHATQKVTGYTSKEFMTIDLVSKVNKDELETLRKNYLEVLGSKGKSCTLTHLFQMKNGEQAWIETTLTNLLHDPAVKGMVLNFRNVTERILLEKQKDDFIGIATHELKTPVTSIKAYTQLLLKRFTKDGNTAAAALVTKMDGQLDKLIGLIGDLLDVTKMEGGRLPLHEEFYDFNGLVTELTEQIQRTTDDHKINTTLSPGTSVFGDKERVGQVLTNLITNAIKYSPASGEIFVSTHFTESDVSVSVKDKGIGISKENQEKVFERFYRVSGPENVTFPGLGLGLYISSEIIRRQSGRIWVESEKDKGSTFSFCLPLDYRTGTITPGTKKTIIYDDP